MAAQLGGSLADCACSGSARPRPPGSRDRSARSSRRQHRISPCARAAMDGKGRRGGAVALHSPGKSNAARHTYMRIRQSAFLLPAFCGRHCAPMKLAIALLVAAALWPRGAFRRPRRRRRRRPRPRPRRLRERRPSEEYAAPARRHRRGLREPGARRRGPERQPPRHRRAGAGMVGPGAAGGDRRLDPRQRRGHRAKPSPPRSAATKRSPTASPRSATRCWPSAAALQAPAGSGGAASHRRLRRRHGQCGAARPGDARRADGRGRHNQRPRHPQ